MTQLVLHHYALSPYGRKVRAAFGYKTLAWLSCDQPMAPPRPALATLAGGYRRIPVLQSGADIFCDSNMIVHALNLLAPDPPIRSDDPLSTPASQWFEPRMFTIFSSQRFRTREDFGGVFRSEDEMKAFRADRAAFMQPMQDITRNAENAPAHAAQLVSHANWVEQQLTRSGGPYLNGEALALADLSLWHSFHWIRGKSVHQELLAAFPAVWAWVDRIEAFGEGNSNPVPAADALDIAKSAAPTFSLPHAPLPQDPQIGARIQVGPTDYGLDAVEGELVSLSTTHISIRREAPEVGEVRVHFPRWGYRITTT